MSRFDAYLFASHEFELMMEAERRRDNDALVDSLDLSLDEALAYIAELESLLAKAMISAFPRWMAELGIKPERFLGRKLGWVIYTYESPDRRGKLKTVEVFISPKGELRCYDGSDVPEDFRCVIPITPNPALPRRVREMMTGKVTYDLYTYMVAQVRKLEARHGITFPAV